MKDSIHIKSPFQEMASEGKSLTADEYLQLGELLKQFKESDDSYRKLYIIDEIRSYVDRFPIDSKVVFYFNNWSKTTTLSDPYMSLVQILRRLSQEVYQENFFEKLL